MEDRDRKQVEKKLKDMFANNVPIEEVFTTFPSLDTKAKSDLRDIWTDSVVGRMISHWWFDRELNVRDLYCGKIERPKKKDKSKYVVSYWKEDQAHEESTEYIVCKFEIAADTVFGDLILSY